MQKTITPAFLPTVLIMFATTSEASTIGLSLDASVGTYGSASETYNPPFSPGPELSMPPLSIIGSDGSALVDDGVVQFGNITGEVSSWATAVSTAASGEASFTGIWQDTLTVTSSSLAPGTAVNLYLTMRYSSNILCDGSNCSPSSVETFQVGNQVLSEQTTALGSTLGSEDAVLTTYVGSSLTMEGSLALAVTSGAGSHTTVDPSVNFYIDPLTAGASYVTGSGTDYLSPVPLPATAWLMLSGLGALGISTVSFSRRRRNVQFP